MQASSLNISLKRLAQAKVMQYYERKQKMWEEELKIRSMKKVFTATQQMQFSQSWNKLINSP